MDSTFGVALGGLFGTVIALAVVLGLAYLSLRALRHYQDRGFARDGTEVQRTLRFVRALPLGQRERLVLVEVEGELLLVGVSAGSVNLIRSWDRGGSPDAALTDEAADEVLRAERSARA